MLTLERVLFEVLSSRSIYPTATAGTIGGAGYTLLAAHRRPHHDIVLPSATVGGASRLLTLFEAGPTSPFRRRGR